MATPETLADWNKLLACCCEMPSCPLPLIECESKSGSSAKDLLTPFAEPATDEYPRLYETLTPSTTTHYEGELVERETWYGPPDPAPIFSSYTISYEIYRQTTITANPTSYDVTGTQWQHSYEYVYPSWETPLPPVGYNECNTTIDPFTLGFGSAYHDYVESTECTQTETLFALDSVQTFQSGGTKPTRQGCPGPHPNLGLEEWWDYRKWDRDALTLSDPVTKIDMRDEAITEMDADTWATGGCTSFYRFESGPFGVNPRWPTKQDTAGDPVDWPACADSATQEVPVWCYTDKTRFRFRVPNTHAGTWFLATWDLVFFPADGSTPEVVAADQTDEWTGPGTGDQDDPSWEFPGGWHEIPLPTEEGETRVVNLRYACYRGPYGYRPQTTGEGYDIPPP